jgi:hypothetical protein
MFSPHLHHLLVQAHNQEAQRPRQACNAAFAEIARGQRPRSAGHPTDSCSTRRAAAALTGRRANGTLKP